MILFFNKVWCERIERDNVQKKSRNHVSILRIRQTMAYFSFHENMGCLEIELNISSLVSRRHMMGCVNQSRGSRERHHAPSNSPAPPVQVP
jgi:hypothetical protein